MNINHAKTEEVNGDKLKAIFDRQKYLMEKYHGIEERSGLLQTPDCPVNLDDKRGQSRIKDFAWRTTEELGEALDAMHDTEHYHEELIDGLHFLTELTILAGKDYNTIHCQKMRMSSMDELDSMVHEIIQYQRSSGLISLDSAVTFFIEQLAMMCNCLKNKPWKQSQMKTDQNQFYLRLDRVWFYYIYILHISGMGPDDIVNTYLKKSQVNLFRQRSNY